MEIVPNSGIGNVQFGMSPAEVLASFPEAQKYEDWMGGNLNDSLLFHGLIFGFDKCDGSGPLSDSRLVELTVHGREDARLWGKRIGDWSKGAAVEYLGRSDISFEIQRSGDLLVPVYSMALSFAEGELLEYVEAWANIERKAQTARTGIRRVFSFLLGRAQQWHAPDCRYGGFHPQQRGWRPSNARR